MKIIIATSRQWNESLVSKLNQVIKAEIFLLTKKEELTVEKLEEIKPDFVFFPHWSYIIKPEIHQNFKCVIFHMTDLPFGRGGSPLQNLIANEIEHTKISALVCTDVLDGGDVYQKRPLSLKGSAREIFNAASEIIFEMIIDIATKGLVPVAQTGTPTFFARRTPTQSNIYGLNNLKKIYDYIRMLDAEGYPFAFIENDLIKYEFTNARFDGSEIIANVRIRSKS